MFDDYHKWRKEMALERKVCLACEVEEWANNTERTCDELDGFCPNADPHEGPYCKRKVA